MRVADLPGPYQPPLVRDRAGLMREVSAAWAELDGFVLALADAGFDRQVAGLGEGADTWTVKDVVARLFREWHARPAVEVVAEHRASYSAMVDALAAVPEANLLWRKRNVLWLTPAIGHPRLHLADMRRALEAD